MRFVLAPMAGMVAPTNGAGTPAMVEGDGGCDGSGSMNTVGITVPAIACKPARPLAPMPPVTLLGPARQPSIPSAAYGNTLRTNTSPLPTCACALALLGRTALPAQLLVKPMFPLTSAISGVTDAGTDGALAGWGIGGDRTTAANLSRKLPPPLLGARASLTLTGRERCSTTRILASTWTVLCGPTDVFEILKKVRCVTLLQLER